MLYRSPPAGYQLGAPPANARLQHAVESQIAPATPPSAALTGRHFAARGRLWARPRLRRAALLSCVIGQMPPASEPRA